MPNYTEEEYRFMVYAYLNMHLSQLRNETTDLKSVLDTLDSQIPSHTRPAIRVALQNIGGAIVDEGLVPVSRLAPRSNYNTKYVPDLIEEFLDENEEYRKIVEDTLDGIPEILTIPSDILLIEEEPPPPTPSGGRRRGMPGIGSGNRGRRDANNAELGLKGENLVLEFERARLLRDGPSDLVEGIKHVAAENDSAGYDILSFEPDGSDRHIEVKTTNAGPRRPFFISPGEKRFSADNCGSYCLYRVYRFARSPRLFIRRGCVDDNFRLEPSEYRVYL